MTLSTNLGLYPDEAAATLDDELQGFLFQNGMQHFTWQRLLLKQGKAPLFFPIFDIGSIDEWKFLHWRMHDSVSLALNGGNAPDLDNFEISDPEQFNLFLQLHTSEHSRINRLLGLV